MQSLPNVLKSQVIGQMDQKKFAKVSGGGEKAESQLHRKKIGPCWDRS